MTSSDDERERRESLAASLNSTIQLAIKYFNNFHQKLFYFITTWTIRSSQMPGNRRYGPALFVSGRNMDWQSLKERIAFIKQVS